MRWTISAVKRTAVAVTAAAAVGGLAVAVPALAQGSRPAAAAASRAVPACPSSGIDDWLNTTGSSASGTIYYHLNFTNLSGHACALQGYPFVFAVNLTGHQIGNRAVRYKIFPVKSVTVGIGKTIYALLGIKETSLFSTSSCKPVTAAGLKVFAPSGISEIGRTVPFPFRACSTRGKSAPNYLKVTVVK